MTSIAENSPSAVFFNCRLAEWNKVSHNAHGVPRYKPNGIAPDVLAKVRAPGGIPTNVPLKRLQMRPIRMHDSNGNEWVKWERLIRKGTSQKQFDRWIPCAKGSAVAVGTYPMQEWAYFKEVSHTHELPSTHTGAGEYAPLKYYVWAEFRLDRLGHLDPEGEVTPGLIECRRLPESGPAPKRHTNSSPIDLPAKNAPLTDWFEPVTFDSVLPMAQTPTINAETPPLSEPNTTVLPWSRVALIGIGVTIFIFALGGLAWWRNARVVA